MHQYTFTAADPFANELHGYWSHQALKLSIYGTNLGAKLSTRFYREELARVSIHR